MASMTATLVCLLFIVSSLCYLTFNRPKREILLSRFGLRGRENFQSQTPPRSLSPKKTGLENDAAPDYTEVFPPHRREAFAAIYDELPTALKAKWTASELGQTPAESRAHVPLAVPEDQLVGNEYTSTGFSVEEIRLLGDFPNYAALSGVPLPSPNDKFDINKALPRPYRPLRWAYHQTMSLTKMDADYWLEFENTYVTRIRQRQETFAKHGKLVLQALPGSEMACKELMEMCIQFVCARYPHHFTLDKQEMVLNNKILDTKTLLKSTHPLHVILNNIPEDFAIMLRNPDDGSYSFRAGVLCSALGWNVDTKIGKRLHEIHEPVPDYKEKMQFSMDRYFAKKPTDKSIQRGSWGIEVDQPLFMPPGHPHEAYRTTQTPDLDLSRLHLRVDWQTLRRLPLTGAIIFNFKALFTPITSFRDEPFVPALALKVLKEGKKNMMEYKATWHTDHVTQPVLEEWKREQEEKGWVPVGWEPHTLDEAPYFPGWEEKWRDAQGF